jgi:hypothetical protein
MTHPRTKLSTIDAGWQLIFGFRTKPDVGRVCDLVLSGSLERGSTVAVGLNPVFRPFFIHGIPKLPTEK